MPESKVWSVKVGRTASACLSACLPRFLWHSSYTIGCARMIDWEVDYASSSQVVGRQQRRISPDCCISQSVRPHFLALVCLDEHHKNNKKMQRRQSSPKMIFSSLFYIGSSISILFLPSLEAFEQHWDAVLAKKPQEFLVFLWEKGRVFDVVEFHGGK